MSRKRKNKPKRNSNHSIQQNVVVAVQDNFDYQKFADAMVEAQMRAKEIEKNQEVQEHKNKQDEWLEILGIKEQFKSKYRIVNELYWLKSSFIVFWKIMFFKKENAKYNVATTALLHVSVNSMLSLIKIPAYVISILLTAYSVCSIIMKTFVPIIIVYFALAFLLFAIARIIRVVQFEIDNINDSNYLIGILSSISSFVAMIIAIIALII